MEFKLHIMGFVKNICFITLFIPNLFFTQINTAVKISKNDSVNFSKAYQNIQILMYFDKKNIEYNKKNKLNYNNFAHGVRMCDKCKKESYYWYLRKTRNQKIIINEEISLNTYVYKKMKKRIIYFLINGEYYEVGAID